MQTLHLPFNSFFQARNFKGLLLTFALFYIGCAKDLPLNVPDDLKDNVHGIQAIESTSFEITTGESNPQGLSYINPLLSERAEVPVTSNTAPAPFNQIFTNAKIFALPNKTYQAKLKIFENQSLVVFIEDKGDSQLKVEKGIMEALAEGNAIPVLSFPISGFGNLQRSTNELNEETRNVEFKEVRPEDAHYIKVNLLSSNRTMIMPSKEEMKDIFSISKLNGLKLILTTGEALSGMSEKNLSPISSIQGPKIISSLLSHLAVPLRENNTYGASFKIQDENNLILVIKATKDDLTIPALSEMMIEEGMPVASYPILKMGIFEQAVGANGKKLLSTQFTTTSNSQATHLRLNPLPEATKVLGVSQNLFKDIFSISELIGNNKIEVEFQKAIEGAQHNNLSAYTVLHHSFSSVESIQGPSRELNLALKESYLPTAFFGKTKIHLEIQGGKYLVGSIDTPEAAHSIIKSTAQNKRIPIFYLPIQAHGRYQKILNDQNKDLLQLEFVEKSLQDSTHIKISPLPQNIQWAGIGSIDLASLEEIFSVIDLDKKIITNKDLTQFIGHKIFSESEDTILKLHVDTDGRLVVKLPKLIHELNVQELDALKIDDLKSEISLCSEEDIQTMRGISKKFDESCVLVSKYEINFNPIYIKNVNESNEKPFRSPSFQIADLPPGQKLEFIQIKKDSIFKTSDWISNIGLFAANKFMLPTKIGGASSGISSNQNLYYFRRVLIDSPNTFNYTFAGTSGDLQVVEFHFTENSLEIKKAFPDLKKPGSSSVDQEVLMRLPVRGYFLVQTRDSLGRILDRPVYVKTSYDNKEAVALLDWSQNRIPDINSPLTYYELGQCFAGDSGQEVSEFEINDNSLGLTLSHHMIANPNVGCVDVWGKGYFDGQTQTQLTFKERLSFKKVSEELTTESFGGNIPYEAQKKLGFGLFTYNKTVPDSFGSTTTDKTVQSLPAIFDIKNDRKITYTLAGIPQLVSAKGKIEKDPLFKTEELRDALITSTAQTMSDINQGFEKAFKGTGFRTPGIDVIEFTLEMDDTFEVMIFQKFKDKISIRSTFTPAVNLTPYLKYLEKNEASQTYSYRGYKILPRRVMGDLDRNYVYYVEKQTDASIIGLGGAHPNNINGKVESASIYLYGGNMRRMINSFRKLEAAEETYIKNTTHMAALSSEELSNSNEAEVESAPVLEAESHLHQTDERTFISLQSQIQNEKLTTMTLRPRSLNIRPESIMAHKELLVNEHNFSLSGQKGPALLERFGGNRPSMELAKWLEQIRVEGKEKNLWARPLLLKSSIEKNMPLVSLQGHENPHSIKEALGHKAGFEAKLFQALQDKGICLYDTTILNKLVSEGKKSTHKMNNLELFIASWKPTVAHEIGHNLGLRHNFIASFDKPNHKFDETDSSARTYSSVMDYLVDDHFSYDGLGPYDVHALRAAYTGLLELDPNKAQGTKFISIDSIPEKLKLNSWVDFTENSVAQLGVKPYRFCSDEEAGNDPLCARFDFGTTAVQAVEYKINQYLYRYSLSNFPGDKLYFGPSDTGSYIGGLFSTFVGIRQFLEESFYQAIYIRPSSQDPAAQLEFQQRLNDYFMAAYKGYQFLLQVIQNPDVPNYLDASSDKRFIQTELTLPERQEDGTTIQKKTPIVIETKTLKDQSNDSQLKRLKVRGVEFDKTVALIALTSDTFGQPRYLRRSLVISYPMFERFVLGQEKIEDSSLVNSLKDILLNDITPHVWAKQGFAIPLVPPYYQGPNLKVEISELIRNYAVLGAIANLDINTFEASLNPSRSFRVISDFNLPKNLPYVSMEEGDLAYAPLAKSFASYEIIKSGDLIRKLNSSTLRPLLKEFSYLAVHTLGIPGEDLKAQDYVPEIFLELESKLEKLLIEEKEILADLAAKKDKTKTDQEQGKEKEQVARLNMIIQEKLELMRSLRSMLSTKISQAPEAQDATKLDTLKSSEMEILRDRIKKMSEMIQGALSQGATLDQVKRLVMIRMQTMLELKPLLASEVDIELMNWIDRERPINLSSEVLEGFIVESVLVPAVNAELGKGQEGRDIFVTNTNLTLEQIAKNLSLVGTLLADFPTSDVVIYIPEDDQVLKVDSLSEIVPTGVNENRSHLIMSSVKLLSDIFTMLHPDYQ